MNNKGYVNLGDVCRKELGLQCQYGSRYADPAWSTESAREAGSYWKYCGEGLRIIGTSTNYHLMKIHRNDVKEFVKRVKETYSEKR
jgi:hypothetical protein